ncbi:MAG: DinB family protein [Vicinamibacterales bacterium]
MGSRQTRGRVEQFLRQIDQAYDGKSWHGTNLRGSLRRVTLTQAAWRPEPGRHNIWELALHAAYWKYAVRRRLTGEARSSFPLDGSNFFTRSDAGTEAEWKRDLVLLRDEHRKLRAAVAALSDQSLDRPPAGGGTLAVDLVAGIIAHDLYHAGQIQLLKRLAPRRYT